MKQKGTFTDTVQRFRTICAESGETVQVGITSTTATQDDKVTERHKGVYLSVCVEGHGERCVFLNHKQALALSAALHSYAVRATPYTGANTAKENPGNDE